MKKGFIKRAALALAALQLCSASAYAGGSPAGTVYSVQPEFSDSATKEYIDSGVVLRIGNTQGFVNGLRSDMDESYYEIMPRIIDGESYIPLEYTLTGLGASITKVNDKEYSVSADGKSFTVRADEPLAEGAAHNVKYLLKCMYAPAADVAKVMGKYVYDDKELIIISENSAIENPNKSVIEKLKSATEFRFGKMYLGAEGFICGIIEHPLDPDIKYARTDVGGVYRWNPESRTFTQLSMVFPYEERNTAGGCTGFAVDPNNKDVLWARLGTFKGNGNGVFKSTDRGKSWTKMLDTECYGTGIRTSGESLAVDPHNSDIVYTGTTEQGLWITKDGGKNWTQSASIQKAAEGYEIGAILFDPSKKDAAGNTAHAYVATAGKGLFETTDSGMSFTPVAGSPEQPLQMRLCDGYLFLSAAVVPKSSRVTGYCNGGLFKYKSGKWTEITPPVPIENAPYKNGVNGFMIDRTNHDFIIAAGEAWAQMGGWFARSWDGGKTWEKFSWYGSSTLMQDGKNPQQMWVCTGESLDLFTDIYADIVNYKLPSYREEKGIEEPVDLKILSTGDPKAPMLLVNMYDRGYGYCESMFKKATYQHHEGLYCGIGTAIDYCRENPKFVARVGRYSVKENNIVLSDNYGRGGEKSYSWAQGKPAVSIAVSATVQKNGYPIVLVGTSNADEGGSGTIYRSLDWGKTWEKTEGAVCNVNDTTFETAYRNNFLVADAVDGKTFYYCENKDFYVSHDYGATWNVVGTLQDSGWPDLHAVPGKEGWLYMSRNGSMFRSTNGGATWEKITTLEMTKYLSFGKGKPGGENPALYALGRKDGVYGLWLSDDMGETFRRVDDASKNYFMYEDTQLAGDMGVYGRVFVSLSGSGVIYFQKTDIDNTAPLITLDNTSSAAEYGVDYAVSEPVVKVSGALNEPGEVRINNMPAAVGDDFKFSLDITLKEGENDILIEAADVNGNKSESKRLSVRYIPGFLGMEIDGKHELFTNKDSVEISGKVSEPATICINGVEMAKTDAENSFKISYTLTQAEQTLSITAKTESGRTSREESFVVHKDNTPPTANIEIPDTAMERRIFNFGGTLSEKGEIRINDLDVRVDDDLSFSTIVLLDSAETQVKVQCKDVAGNVSKPVYYSIKRDMSKAVDKTKLTIPYRSQEFVFDGDVSEWDLTYEMDEPYFGDVNNTCYFNYMWDEENLYVGVKVYDKVHYTDNLTNYNNDGIEVYIDGNNTKGDKYDNNCGQFIIVADNKSVYSPMKLTDYGYTMEIKIPWSNVRIEPKAGHLVGLDINNINNDGELTNNDRGGVIGFNGTINNWQYPKPWTTYELVK